MARQRPDGDVAVLVPDVGKLVEPADVDQHLGHREPQLHQREQRMPARQVLAVVTGLGGEVEGLLDGAGSPVGKRCRDHEASPGSSLAWSYRALTACCCPSRAAASTALTMLW